MTEFKIEEDWKGPYDDLSSCPYNAHVGCDKGDCQHCGWNPFVSIYRISIEYGTDAANNLTSPGR